MTDRELMQQALDALEHCAPHQDLKNPYFVIEAIRARLAQPEPEPVAWFMEGTFEDGTPSFTQVCESDPEFYVPLYTAPPQREWQGLTDEERTFIAWESNNGPECVAMTEAKLKEKNGF